MEAHFQCADPEDPGKNQCYNGKRQIQVEKFLKCENEHQIKTVQNNSYG